MKNTDWLEDFSETCQAIEEDAFLLDALALYASSDHELMENERAEYILRTFCRLSDYLLQHAMDLHTLGKWARPGLL